MKKSVDKEMQSCYNNICRHDLTSSSINATDWMRNKIKKLLTHKEKNDTIHFVVAKDTKKYVEERFH